MISGALITDGDELWERQVRGNVLLSRSVDLMETIRTSQYAGAVGNDLYVYADVGNETLGRYL